MQDTLFLLLHTLTHPSPPSAFLLRTAIPKGREDVAEQDCHGPTHDPAKKLWQLGATGGQDASDVQLHMGEKKTKPPCSGKASLLMKRQLEANPSVSRLDKPVGFPTNYQAHQAGFLIGRARHPAKIGQPTTPASPARRLFVLSSSKHLVSNHRLRATATAPKVWATKT